MTLVTALLLKRRWACPTAILAFLLFLVYQLYRYSHTRSPELLVLSVLDVLVIGLTLLEYRRLRHAHGFWREDTAASLGVAAQIEADPAAFRVATSRRSTRFLPAV